MEKIVKKKILSLLLAFVLSVSMFAGCNLVTTDDKTYYTATVATITYGDGTKEDISKRELITAYSSYGYNYVDNYGMTLKEAIMETLDTVVESKLTSKAVVDSGYVLNDNETSYLWSSTYDGFISNLKSYLDNNSDDEDEDSDDSSSSVYDGYTSEYTSSFKIVVDENGNISFEKSSRVTTTKSTTEYVDALGKLDGEAYNFEVEKFKEKMYDCVQNAITSGGDSSKKAWQKALDKYLKIVKENYSYITFNTNKDCMLFEFDRIYQIMKTNYYSTVYETIYNQYAKEDSVASSVTANKIVETYKNKVAVDYNSYATAIDTTTYTSNMLSSVGDVDYILTGTDATNYFYIAPIKIERKTTLSDLDTQKANGKIDAQTYNEKVAEINNMDNKIVTIRNEKGEDTNEKISINELYTQISKAVTSAGKYSTDENADEINNAVALQKADAFKKYFYLYNDDDTYKNADYNAVFGVDKDNNAVTSDDFDDDAIKSAIVSLYNGGDVKVGDISEVVQTDDAYYIFFYAGKIDNLFPVVNGSVSVKTNEAINVFASTRTNIFSQKTLLDVLYSECESDNFSDFTSMNMNKLKHDCKSIKYFEANLKSLYEE